LRRLAIHLFDLDSLLAVVEVELELNGTRPSLHRDLHRRHRIHLRSLHSIAAVVPMSVGAVSRENQTHRLLLHDKAVMAQGLFSAVSQAVVELVEATTGRNYRPATVHKERLPLPELLDELPVR